MGAFWVPKSKSDLQEVKVTADRHIEHIQNNVNTQRKSIMKLARQYQKKGLINIDKNKKVKIQDNDMGLGFNEFEYIKKDSDGRNIYNMTVLIFGPDIPEYLRIGIAKSRQNIQQIGDTSYLDDEVELRPSPYGGPSSITPSLGDNDEYYYEYCLNNELYQIRNVTFKDYNNFDLKYCRKSKNGKESSDLCGLITCLNGKITQVGFETIEDFKQICNLYKTKDLSQVSNNCHRHFMNIFRREKDM